MTVQTMQQHEAVTLHHGIRDFRRRAVNELARRYVLGPSVLDLRCLAGHLTVALAGDGHEVVGLDAYAPAVEMTNVALRREGFPESAQLWDLTGLVDRVGRDRFDTVVCLDVLNHVRDDRETLAEIEQVLNPGGRVVLLVPALHRLLGARDRKLGHLRRYERKQLIALLGEHGFGIERVRFWNALPLPAQYFWEAVLKRELRDPGRYGPPNAAGEMMRRLLAGWYLHVENRIPFPAGLSLLAVARRRRA